MMVYEGFLFPTFSFLLVVLCQSVITLERDGRDGKQEECKYEISVGNDYDTISSPNYPRGYPDNMNCSWHFTAQPGKLILLVFDMSDTEHDLECTSDYITLYDGNLTASKNLGKYCGYKVLDQILSSSNELYMVFISDSMINKEGFSARYKSVTDRCTNKNVRCQHKCQTTIKSLFCSCNEGFILDENGYDCNVCRNEMREPEGNFTSPKFPIDYPSNANCVWLITTTPGKVIRLVFEKFFAGEKFECETDYIVLYNGNSSAAPTIGHFCGYFEPKPVTSSTNELYMVFKSSNEVKSRGFSASYTSVPEVEVTENGFTSFKYKTTTAIGMTESTSQGPEQEGTSKEGAGVTAVTDAFNMPPWLLIVILTILSIFIIPVVCYLGIIRYRAYITKNELVTERKKLDSQLKKLRDASDDIMTEFNPNYASDGGIDNDLKHIPYFNLRLVKLLGRGAFGEVYEGLYKQSRTKDAAEVPVAVETLPERSTSDVEKDFLMEALIMNKFNHKNIVQLIGICFEKNLRFIVIELLNGGDLQAFLRESRASSEGSTPLTVPDLLSCAIDVARGCEYLEKKKFIHRDIAARNCLLTTKGPGRIVKIADFGMARDMYRAIYYKKGGNAVLPIRWMPPEAFLDGIFTFKTDVWSFGVLLWEVMSLGYMPYADCTNREVISLVSSGSRLEPPINCPIQLYSIMTSCWSKNPEDRPDFGTILQNLESCIQNADITGSSLSMPNNSASHKQERIIEKPPIGDCIPSDTSKRSPGALPDRDGIRLNYLRLSLGSHSDHDDTHSDDYLQSLNTPPTNKDDVKLNYAMISSRSFTDEDGVQLHDSTPFSGLTSNKDNTHFNYSKVAAGSVSDDDGIQSNDSLLPVSTPPSSEDHVWLNYAILSSSSFTDEDGVQLHDYTPSSGSTSNQGNTFLNYSTFTVCLLPDDNANQSNDSTVSANQSPSNEDHGQPEYAIISCNSFSGEDRIQLHDSRVSPRLTSNDRNTCLNYSTLAQAQCPEENCIQPDFHLPSPDKTGSKHQNCRLTPNMLSSKDSAQFKCAVLLPDVYSDDDSIQLHHSIPPHGTVSNKIDRNCLNYAILAPALLSEEDCFDKPRIPLSGLPKEHTDSNESILSQCLPLNKDSIRPDDPVTLPNLPSDED